MALPGTRRRRLVVVIAAVLFVLFLAFSLAGFYTDVLWFQEVGIAPVLWTTLGTQWGLGVVVGAFMAVLLWINLVVAQRVAPPYRAPRLEVVGRTDPLDQYRELVSPHLNTVRIAIAGVIGLLTGLGASAGWQTVLLWINRVDFGRVDPQFERDIGFYVFELPLFNMVLDYLWFAFLISFLLAIGAHFFHGSIRPEAGLPGLWPGALAHLSVLLGCLALVKAGQYWYGRFSLNFSVRGAVTGASYTDVNAHLPALSLLAIISVISAVLFIVNIRFRRLSLPLGAVGLWIFFSIAAGAVWPGLVQRFSVEPQELQREREFIERNITSTQEAFGLSDVKTQSYPATTDLTGEQIQQNEGLVQNVRVWDPGILQTVYRQLQAIRTYYQFPDVDIDRYEIGGRSRQVLLSARELSVADLPEGSRSWANQHLFYTHGYGLVASLANEQTSTGQP
ncbi:MAG: UPF0182 family protein, partial [Actinobacteria bacterium]|nr:UPF0182 family protein [Actinomycetota bacterium]